MIISPKELISFLFIIIVLGVVVFVIYTTNRPKNKLNRRKIPTLEETSDIYDQQIDSSTDVLNEAGLDGEDIVSSLGLRKTECMLPPQDNGQCAPGFIKQGDCCSLSEENIKSGRYQQEMEFMAELAKGYLAGEIVENTATFLIERSGQQFFKMAVKQEASDWILEEGTEKGTRRLLQKSTNESFEFAADESLKKIMQKVSTKALSQVLEKSMKEFVERVIKNAIAKALAYLMVKVATWIARFMMFMSAGPAGVMIGIIDTISTAIDFMDFSGFNLYSSNAVNLKLRDVCEYNYAMTMQNSDLPYPALLELSEVYPIEYETVTNLVKVEFAGDAIIKAFDQPGGSDEVFKFLIGDTEDIPIITRMLEEVMGEKHLEVNLMIHDLMQDALSKMETPPKYKIQLYPDFSAPYRNAVSLTKESAQQWNEDHYEEWFDFLSGEKEYDVEKGEGPPTSIVFTKNYGIVNPSNTEQDSSNPDMIQKSLKSAVPLAGYHYIVMKECLSRRAPMRMPREARRSGGGIMNDIAAGFMELQYAGSASLTPSKYGVTFDSDTRTCKFTPEYCEHVGLKYNASGASGTSDCKLWPGQYEAELIFGTAITRGAIKFGNDPEKEMKDFFQETVINIWQDPERWAQQYKNVAIRTGDMAKNAALGIAQRAKNFGSAFGKNPPKAVVDAGIEVAQKGIEVQALVNPFAHAHRGCQSIGGAGGTACSVAVFAVFPPASIMVGLSALDKELGVTKELGKVFGVGSNNPYNPIFFQVDSEGNQVDSHEHKDVNNKKTIKTNTVAMYFKFLHKEGSGTSGPKYYARIFNNNGTLVVDNLFPDESTKLIDLSSYNDGSYKIMLKH